MAHHVDPGHCQVVSVPEFLVLSESRVSTGGAAATKHTVSHWVRDAIGLAYEARGQASPLGVRAHSTRGFASSTALARGAPCSKFVMQQVGPLRTHLLDSIVWMFMLLRARTSLSRHPRVMSETSSMFVHTH